MGYLSAFSDQSPKRYPRFDRQIIQEQVESLMTLKTIKIRLTTPTIDAALRCLIKGVIYIFFD